MLHGVGGGTPVSASSAWGPGVRGPKSSNFSTEKDASAFPWTPQVQGTEVLLATHLSSRPLTLWARSCYPSATSPQQSA